MPVQPVLRSHSSEGISIIFSNDYMQQRLSGVLNVCIIYRVIHKSVKHFKNSQQINYSTDHGSSYADRETLQVFFTYFTDGITADIYAIVHLVPHACQHITVDQSHSSGDTVAKIWRLAGSRGTKTVSFTTPQKKKSHGVKSGDRGGHRINVSSSFLVRSIHLCGKFRLRYPRTFL